MEVAELHAGEPQTQPKLRTEGDKRPLVAVVAAAMAASVGFVLSRILFRPAAIRLSPAVDNL